jgi:hypothetical protein
LVTYSALRLGLLAACFALGYWAGLRTWLLLFVATFVAWGLSYVLLAGPRDAAALYVAERAARRAAGTGRPTSADDDAAHEDAVVEAARSQDPRHADAPVTEGDPGRVHRPTEGRDAVGPAVAPPAAPADERPRDRDRP